MPYTTEQIRNVALVGHASVGKTTLFEALLVAGGTLTSAGTIERGSTLSDTDPMEKARGHSINSAIASIDHAGIHVNLIDTPGYPDFRGPTLSALAAVETCAVVVSATGGVEYGTRRMMEYAKSRNLCRVIVINKIDADGVDFSALLDELRDGFGNECLPINLPAQGGKAVVDCFFQPDGESDLGPVALWHQKIIDQIVEVNEEIMSQYLENGEHAITGQQLHDAFEQSLREGHLVPICFVSARANVGIRKLLDIAEKLFPNPLEANLPPLQNGQGNQAQPVSAQITAGAHLIADVFKIINDPFVGKLSIFRVYQGMLRKDSQLYIDDSRKPFKVGHLYKLKGKDHIEVDQAIPGDIVAVAKVDEIHFDAILHDSHDEDQIRLAPLPFPKPMFGLAIEAATRGQEQKLATALQKLSEEDPCFQVEHHHELNETVVRGLSDLHLKINLEKLSERYQVEIKTRPPRIAYRETVAGHAEGHHRHKKQTGGAGQFGEVHLRVEPLERGQGFEFVDAVKGGVIPHQFMPAVEKGVRQVLNTGAIAGYALQDIRVTVFDGKHHSVDSKEVAFVAAGRKAFLDAIAKARPQVLEPIVDLSVAAPEQHMGDITASLASKRARINGTDSARDEVIVRAQVPLSELESYAAELKSVTAGRGRYDLEFSHYEPVPGNVQKQLIESYRPHHDEE